MVASLLCSFQRMIVATGSGLSVTMVSAHRPNANITSVTNNIQAARRSSLLWGVDSVLVREHKTDMKTIKSAVKKLVADGRLMPGDTVVTVGGSPKAMSGPTNTLRLLQLGSEGEVLAMPPVSTFSVASNSSHNGANGRRAHRNDGGRVLHDDDSEPQPSIWTSWCVHLTSRHLTSPTTAHLHHITFTPHVVSLHPPPTFTPPPALMTVRAERRERRTLCQK
jgi:hypothetical protein